MTAPLAIGTRNHAVAELKRRLQQLGYWPYTLGGTYAKHYGPKTAEAVQYFQQTHVGPDGRFLTPDGVVGPQTRWALEHPFGAPQSNGYSDLIPAGLEPGRHELLRVAVGERGVIEDPIGSNRSPRIDEYAPSWAQGTAWCCWYMSWCDLQAAGEYTLGRIHGACQRAWEAAQRLGLARGPDELPRPGDAFLVYSPGRGRMTHIGFTLRVSADGDTIDTSEGNCANRVKIGRRRRAELGGFIDMRPIEHGDGWQRGLSLEGASSSTDATR